LATIKDIAMHAKVSTATVSRVINEKSSVAPDLRDAVLAAMKELNYYPNSIARSLKKESSMTIGLVMLEPENAHITVSAARLNMRSPRLFCVYLIYQRKIPTWSAYLPAIELTEG
jgi:LacI family transcriptional regulator